MKTIAANKSSQETLLSGFSAIGCCCSAVGRGIPVLFLSLLMPFLCIGTASAHSVAQVQTTKFFAPETVQMLKDRATAGHPGFQVGDTASYIVQFTPVENALNSPSGQSNFGVNGYVTDYIPSGTEVIGAFIAAKSGSNFVPIPPSLPGGIDTGWGGRGQITYRAPFNTSAYDPTGRCAAPVPTTDTFTASGTWQAPAGVTSVTVEAWGGGGAGGGTTTNSTSKGGGGAGGQYVSRVVTVVPGNNYAIVVGAGGTGSNNNGTAGGNSTFAATTAVAAGGAGGQAWQNGGTAGVGSAAGGTGDTIYAGGSGSNGSATATGGAGGGGGGSAGAGGSATGNTAGSGTTVGGGNGAPGRTTVGNGTTGTIAGGGGAGAYTTDATNRNGGNGARGQILINYSAPLYTDDCNGRLTESIADTGIFYSTDPRTAQYPALPNRILQGTNGYNILDTNPGTQNGAGQLNPYMGQTQATTHNLWDADQANAFGSLTTDLDGLAAPKSSQTSLVVTVIGGGTYGVLGTSPYYAGSPVAGPQTGYQLDNTAQVGPWQRIAYTGSRMGNAANGPAPAAEDCTTCVGGYSTSAGRTLSASNPLPAGTNAVRWAMGRLTVGEIRYVKVSLRLTAPVPAGGLINGSEVFGGDSSDTDEGDDNAWRYHVPSVADNNSNLFILKEVIGACTGGAGCTPTASDGSFIPANAKVRYRVIYLNSGNADQTNVILSDTLPCQTGANSVSNISITGPFLPPTPNNPPLTAAGVCGPPATRQTFSLPAVSLGPGEGGTVIFDVLTNAATGALVSNTGRLRSDQITGTATSGGVTSTANSFVQSAPNLNITKTTSTPTLVGGGTATYTITVTNNGTANATAINVYDMLPTTGGTNDANTRFSYAATSGIVGMTSVAPSTSLPPTLTPYDTDSVASNRQQVLWNFGAQTLAAGASFTITFTATVGAGVPASTVTYDNNVAVTYTGNPGRSDAINVAPITVTSSLSVDKTITHYYNSATSSWVTYGDFIPANAKVRYRIDYANTGGSSVTNAVLSDLLPCQTGADSVSNITILGGPISLPSPNPPTLAAGVCSTGTRRTFSFPAATITAGQIGALTFEVQTNAATGDTVVNTASMSATGAAAVTDEVQTSVQSAPVLTISKSESKTGAKPGDTVSYTLTVTNTGTTNATAISVHDWLPSGGVALNAATRYSYTGSSTFGGSITGVTPTTVIPPTKTPYNNVPAGANANVANTQEIVWNFNAQTLTPGASFTITYSAAIGASVPAGYYSNNARAYYQLSSLTGTVATNNTTAVAGTGTLFQSQLVAGNPISINGIVYTVNAITSNTALTLTTAAPTGTGQSAYKMSQAEASAASMYIANAIADVAVTKSNSSITVPLGGSTTYAIVITNSGPDGADGTKVVDPVATGLSKTGVSCSSATGGAACPGTLTVALLEGAGLTIPTLPNGGQVTLLVNANITAGSGSVTNSVTVTLPSGIFEGDWNNNIASDTDMVQTLLYPSILVLKSSQTFSDPINDQSSPKPIPGAFVDYTITVTNSGAGTADDGTTVITDPIPANTELFVGDITGVANTGPILFTDGATTSGLTYTFDTLASTTDDLKFSEDNGVDLYGKNNTTPDGNICDTTVTNIKIPLKGIFKAAVGVNHPSFSIKFRVRIK